jgi:RNA polymerase sigma-70 factor (ECF subfamily)
MTHVLPSQEKTKYLSTMGRDDKPEQDLSQDREASYELHDLMGRLPEQSRTILTLHYLEGLPIAEIAGVLGIPEGTVKSRLHAARNKLKALCRRASEESISP